jgi:hypothetical protein
MEVLFDIQPEPLAEVSLFGYIAVRCCTDGARARRSIALLVKQVGGLCLLLALLFDRAELRGFLDV